mmetsp:Transcript_85422/g.274955  ORF Transcript_85422/g.274955 Transcript_85422/m.274955 type:complete len:230 (+) Transcript_85422:431-1120(+)
MESDTTSSTPLSTCNPEAFRIGFPMYCMNAGKSSLFTRLVKRRPSKRPCIPRSAASCGAGSMTSRSALSVAVASQKRHNKPVVVTSASCLSVMWAPTSSSPFLFHSSFARAKSSSMLSITSVQNTQGAPASRSPEKRANTSTLCSTRNTLKEFSPWHSFAADSGRNHNDISLRKMLLPSSNAMQTKCISNRMPSHASKPRVLQSARAAEYIRSAHTDDRRPKKNSGALR